MSLCPVDRYRVIHYMVEKNRRKTPRVNYPCHLTMWVAQGVYDTVLAQASNIGQEGLCVHLNQGIALGVKIDIQIVFPDTTAPFRCGGSVVRCQNQSDKVYIIGIQFEPLSEIKRAFLERRISELIRLEREGRSSNINIRLTAHLGSF